MHAEEQFQSELTKPLRKMAIAGLSYVRARMELAGIEGKESLTRIGGMLLLAAVAVTLTIVGFLLLCVALVFGIALLLGGGNAWIWVSAIMGGVLLAVAWMLLHWAGGWLRRPMFAATLEEFRKDDAWLRSTAEKHR
jgi:uncharacterized membrane protein YqjE